jgi:hypothetical protein
LGGAQVEDVELSPHVLWISKLVRQIFYTQPALTTLNSSGYAPVTQKNTPYDINYNHQNGPLYA